MARCGLVRAAWFIGGVGTLAIAASILASGCASMSPPQTPYMRKVGSISVTTEELRVRTLSFAHLYMGTVEAAAERIRDESDDPKIDEFALFWKIHSVPTLQEAAFKTDPLAALVDLWALCEQSHDAFATGFGAEELGDHAWIAAEAMAGLLSEVESIAERIGVLESRPDSREKVKAWAKEHPINSRYFVRTSVLRDLTELSASYRRAGGLDAVGAFDDRVRIALDRLPFYTEYLPKQVVWQTELSFLQNASRIRDEMGLEELERLRALDDIDARLGEVVAFTTEVDTLLTAEREATLSALVEEIGEQRRAVLQESAELIATERAVIMLQITAEREAAMREVASIIAAERAVMLEEIDRQRVETIQAVQGECALVLTEAQTIATSTVNASLAEARSVVDHAIIRLAQLMVGAGVVVLVIVIVLRKLWGRARAPPV